MDTDRTAADLVAVQHDIVRLCANLAGIGVEQRKVLVHRTCERMVHRNEAVLLLAPLQEREFDDPQKIELLGIDESQLVSELQAQRAERRPDDRIFVRHDEHDVALLEVRLRLDRVHLVLGEELRDRGLQTLGLPVHPRKSLCLVRLDKLTERVDLFPAEVCRRALCDDAANAAACRERILEHGEAAVLHAVGKVRKFHIEPRIGLIGAVAVHGVLPRDTRQRKLNVEVQRFFEQTLNEALVHRHDVVRFDERHFKVDLRKVRLTVRTKVLVAEAARDLHVAVES